MLLQYLESFILVNKEDFYQGYRIRDREREYAGIKEIGSRLTRKQEIPRNKRIEKQKKESQKRKNEMIFLMIEIPPFLVLH